MHELELDVCVVGGGPAGSITALRLATLGHRVCLVERQVFPRVHVGESLSPGIWPLLDSIGLRELVSRAAFPRPGKTLLCWADSRPQLITSASRSRGLLADRGSFDALLLEAARKNGVHVIQPAKAKVRRTQEGWQVLTDGERFNISVKVLVDASGRKGCLPGRRVPFSQRTVALWVHVNANNECATRLEAIPEGWLWAAPIANNKISLLFFCEPSHIRQSSDRDLERLLRERMTKTTLFSGLAQAKFLGSVSACDATCTYARDPSGADYVLAGEASYSLDPLSSTGVEKALQSAITSAAVVNTLLEHPEHSNLCTQFCRDRQHETVTTHMIWMNQYYREVERYADEPFWIPRRTSPVPHPKVPFSNQVARPRPTTVVGLAPEVSITTEACIIGNEITTRPGLRAPSLMRPVAFVNGIDVRLLLADLTSHPEWEDLLRRWSQRMPPCSAERVAAWLWEKRVLCETKPTIDPRIDNAT
jgi:flavin-dependent dehydrogenase